MGICRQRVLACLLCLLLAGTNKVSGNGASDGQADRVSFEVRIASWVTFGLGCIVTCVAVVSMVRALRDAYWQKARQGRKVGYVGSSIDELEGERLLRVDHLPDTYFPAIVNPTADLRQLHKESEQTAVGPVILLIVKCLLPWPALLRTVEILVNSVSFAGDYLVRPWTSETFFVVFSTSAPNYLLMANYLLLVMFWAWLYSYSRNSFPAFLSGLLSLWGLLVAVEFLIWIILLMFMAAMPNHISTIHKVEELYAAGLSILIALLFAVWGFRLSGKLGSMPASPRTSVILTKVFALTVLCTVLFIVRSVLIVLCSWVFSYDSHSTALFVSLLIWIIGCEFLPTLIVTILLSWSVR